MNRKKFIAICLIVLVIVGGILWFIFRPRPPVDVIPVPVGESCLILQSDDPSKPCFVASRPISTSTTSTNVCAEGSVFEKNDCILKTVQKNGDTGLCSGIQGAIARAACLNQRKDSVISAMFTPPQNTYEAYVRSYVASSPQEASIGSTSKSVETLRISQDSGLSEEQIEGMTPQGLYSRLAEKANLLAYTVSPYQSRPGDTVKIQGTGFALTATNVVHIAGTQVSGLASADGMNLLVTIPSSALFGTNEVWVTNDRGSTRNSQRPIYAVVSQNPVPAPKITGFSPANPKYTDIITLSGENLGGIKAISTTLGIIQGGSLSFRVADLEYVRLVLDQASAKGSVFPLYVFVQADGGINEQPFIINVQF